jgi:uncharacterized protein
MDAGVATGIGLRLPHLAEVVATRPRAGWLEIHPENFLANPHALELLLALREHSPIAVHTVGISIGSADGLDREHLARLRRLVDAIDPVLVSGHLAWSSLHGTYLNDLLPLPYDEASLVVAASHLDQVQNALGRRYLVENPSSYVAFRSSILSEVEFLSELTVRTGCGLLCDVSNVYLSAHNMGYDPYAYIDALPPDAVGELHLGGFTAEDDLARPGSQLLVDTHGTTIADPVWELLAHTIRRVGPAPTLIEWDNDLPSLATLLAEAARADAVIAATARTEVADAAS